MPAMRGKAAESMKPPADIESLIHNGRWGTAEINLTTPGVVLPPFEQSEKEFQSDVLRFAKRNGWLAYHTHDSRKSAKGFPDLVLVRERLLFAELKTSTGKTTPEQDKWIEAIRLSGAAAHVWKPENWPEIVEILSNSESAQTKYKA